MAQVVYSDNALANLERHFHFLLQHDPAAARASAKAITDAVDSLKTHPLLGRRVEGDIRELIISYGKSGHVALYRFLAAHDQVRVLAVRHQAELDYPT